MRPTRCLLSAILCLTVLAAPLPAEDLAGGTVSGRVIYETDPQRPWRYQRYYVKDRDEGFLAEAVVALEGKPLEERDFPAKPKTVEVDQKDFRFVPETSAIRAGDRVTFLNSDDQVHNVRTNDLRPFNVTMPAGGKSTEAFPRAGGIRRPVRLGCIYHSQMRAWIYVFDHPFYVVTGAKGRFTFEDVPPGDYRLHVAHPAGELRNSVDVTVKPGETTTVDLRLSPDDLTRKRKKR